MIAVNAIDVSFRYGTGLTEKINVICDASIKTMKSSEMENIIDDLPSLYIT